MTGAEIVQIYLFSTYCFELGKFITKPAKLTELISNNQSLVEDVADFLIFILLVGNIKR